MPEAAVAPAPAAAPSTPAAQPSGESKSILPPNLADSLASFDKLVEPITKPPPPKEEKPTAPAKPEIPPKEPGKDDGRQDPDKPTPKLYQAHRALQKRVESELEPELARLRKENEELKGRKPEAPEMKEFETVKQERERLAKELAETAYERSDDFRRDFLDPRKAIYDTAVREMQSLSIRFPAGKDDEGNVVFKERPATEQDFRTIYFLPPAQQDRAINEWFGPSAHRVHHYIAEMARNQREADLAIRRHSETYQTKMKQTMEQQKAESQKFDTSLKSARGELESKWPQWFKTPAVDGDNADKELAAAHQGGIALVKDWVEKAPSLPTEEKAAYTAVVMSRAEAFPRLVLENERLRAELKTLKGTIQGKQSGDPGSAIGRPGTSPASAKDELTIASAAAKFDPS